MSKFIIVKYAQDGAWEHYWEEDPKESGIHPWASAHLSYSGQAVGLKPSYESVEAAQTDLNAINSCNPVGQYALCPIVA